MAIMTKPSIFIKSKKGTTSNMSQIHWFPGHMKKALNEIEAKIKLVDIVIEILDARAPLSSINPEFEKRIQNKKKIVIFSKADLADPIGTPKWEQFFKKSVDSLLILNLNEPKSEKIIANEVKRIGAEKHQKEMAKGMKPQPLKTMIIGIPNVGKSSLINRLAKRSAAGVQNKPGYTRGEQFIKVNNDFILLDTPGVLPMNYEEKTKAINLALLGSIKEDILPNEDLAIYLVKYLNKFYPHSLEGRFSISDLSDFESVVSQICNKRGLLGDNEKAYALLLKEFKDGKLGRISLEKVS